MFPTRSDSKTPHRKYKFSRNNKHRRQGLPILLQIAHSYFAEHKKPSADSELHTLICGFLCNISDLNDITTKDQLIQACMTKATIFVGNILLNRQACLLHTVHDHFVHLANAMLCLHASSSSNGKSVRNQEVKRHKPPSRAPSLRS